MTQQCSSPSFSPSLWSDGFRIPACSPLVEGGSLYSPAHGFPSLYTRPPQGPAITSSTSNSSLVPYKGLTGTTPQVGWATGAQTSRFLLHGEDLSKTQLKLGISFYPSQDRQALQTGLATEPEFPPLTSKSPHNTVF